jgi:hypothetical protein
MPQTEETIDELRKLRDEIRVRIHLAAMDARDVWRELEPRVTRVERAIEKKGTAAAEEIGDLGERVMRALRDLKHRLEKQ